MVRSEPSAAWLAESSSLPGVASSGGGVSLGSLVPLLVGSSRQVLFGLSSGLYVCGRSARRPSLCSRRHLANAHLSDYLADPDPSGDAGKGLCCPPGSGPVHLTSWPPLCPASWGRGPTPVAVAICGLVSATYVALQFFSRSLMSAEDSQPRGNALVRS
jgi:hypothetical protein